MTTLQSVLNTQTEGSRPRGRPKLRWMERLKDDMKKNKIRRDRESWFEAIQNVNPTQETTESEKVGNNGWIECTPFTGGTDNI